MRLPPRNDRPGRDTHLEIQIAIQHCGVKGGEGEQGDYAPCLEIAEGIGDEARSDRFVFFEEIDIVLETRYSLFRGEDGFVPVRAQDIAACLPHHGREVVLKCFFPEGGFHASGISGSHQPVPVPDRQFSSGFTPFIPSHWLSWGRAWNSGIVEGGRIVNERIHCASFIKNADLAIGGRALHQLDYARLVVLFQTFVAVDAEDIERQGIGCAGIGIFGPLNIVLVEEMGPTVGQ